MALSSSLETAISNSAKFARSVGVDSIGTEHLLYGILTVSNSRATKLLNSFGIFSEQYKKSYKFKTI